MSLASSLNVGVSALRAYSEGIQTVSNNIANVNTVGYKASHAQYADTFSNILRPMVPNEKGDAAKIAPTQVGGGVQVESVAPVFSQGTIQITNSNSDLAIAGNGFFRVVNPTTQQAFVTRAGNFRVDATGALVTQQGYRVQGSLNAKTDVIYDKVTGGYNVLGPRDNYSVVIPSGLNTTPVTGFQAVIAGSKSLSLAGGTLTGLATGMPIISPKLRAGTIITGIDAKTNTIELSDSILSPVVPSDSFTLGEKSLNHDSHDIILPVDYLRPDLSVGMPLIGPGIKPGTTISDPGKTQNIKVTISASPELVVQDPANGVNVLTGIKDAAGNSVGNLDGSTVAGASRTLAVKTLTGITAGMIISNPGGPFNGLAVKSFGVDSSVPSAGNYIEVVVDTSNSTASGVTFDAVANTSATPSLSLVGAKTLDKRKDYIIIPPNATLLEGDPISGEGIPPGTFIATGGISVDPVTGYNKIKLADSLGNQVFPIADSYAAVRVAFKDQKITLSDFPMTDSFSNVSLSLGNAYKPAASVGDVRISFNEYDNQTADPTKVPDYTFVGTDGKPLDGITLQSARANAPKIRTFNIGTAGEINVVLSNGQTFTAGAVLLQMFKDPGALTREGDNLFSGMLTAGPYNGIGDDNKPHFDRTVISSLTPGTGGLGVINGGALELSNVDLGEEFSTMIITQRAFQAGSRVITTTDQMMEEAVNLKR